MPADDPKRRKEQAEKLRKILEEKLPDAHRKLTEKRAKKPSFWYTKRESEGGIRWAEAAVDSLNERIDEQDRIISIAEADLRAAEEQLAEQAAHRLADIRTPRVKEALRWWNNEAQDLPGYARIYWQQILEDEKVIVSHYKSPDDQCATMERCREIAIWALKEIPLEVAHHLPDEADRTVDKLAHILRRHHGDKAERLIPLARQVLLASMEPAEEPVAPAPANPPADSLLSGLPPELQTELADLEPGLRNAKSVEEADGLVAQLLAKRDQELKDAGVPEQERQNRLARYDRNLQDAVRKWRRARGLL
jgi:hypothetical protein